MMQSFYIYLVTHYVSYVCMLFLASWLLVHPVRKTSYRSYSCSVSLCDPSGYEGGVIQFFRGFGIKDRWQVASVDQRGVATYEVNVGFCWSSERSNGHVDLFGSFWSEEPVANFKCAQGSTTMLGKLILSSAGHSIS